MDLPMPFGLYPAECQSWELFDFTDEKKREVNQQSAYSRLFAVVSIEIVARNRGIILKWTAVESFGATEMELYPRMDLRISFVAHSRVVKAKERRRRKDSFAVASRTTRRDGDAVRDGRFAMRGRGKLRQIEKLITSRVGPAFPGVPVSPFKQRPVFCLRRHGRKSREEINGGVGSGRVGRVSVAHSNWIAADATDAADAADAAAARPPPPPTNKWVTW